MSVSQQHLEIVPSNITSNGKLSYKNGQPTIQLLIGAQERSIVPGSVRLCGKITVFKTPGNIPVEADGIRMNEKLGVYSIIDTLSINSQRTSQTIETINHHNRMMSSYLSVTQSQGDFACHAYETALRFPNYEAMKRGVVDNTQSVASPANSFCIPLVSGLFLGQDPIPLSDQWGVGGLSIEIQLAPDQQVLFSEDNSDANLVDAFYELSDVRLICEVQRPAPDELSRLTSQTTNVFNYNSISSYFNTINSANAILNFNLGLKSVLGCFMNIVPSSHINNFTRDGLATLPFTNLDGTIATIEQAVFTRSGERVPLEYNIDTIQKSPGEAGNQTADPQIIRNYMDAVMDFAKINRSSVDSANYRNVDAGTNFADSKIIPKGGSMWGLGVNYDGISNSGLDMSQTPFGVQLQLGLTSDHPNAIFLFVHSRQTVVSSGGSIEIIK
tara:strand:+ start:390 stop:1715 length:1326 start_codon:yes stop_codon:yes gene_type:complete